MHATSIAADRTLVTDAEIAAAVTAERLQLVELSSSFTAADWAAPSLCAGWSVRHVVAHLTLTTRMTVPWLLRSALRAGGSFDRMERNLAARRVEQFSPSELVEQLRESAASSHRTPGSKPMDPLMDLAIHAQDIAHPLGRSYFSSPVTVAASLAYLVTNTLMGGPKRLRGLRVESTDRPWGHGDGPEVRGSDIDLLLAVSGRPAALAGLTGPGLEVLAARLSA